KREDDPMGVELPGVAWRATVQLVGPDVGTATNVGVEAIEVGFIQFGTVASDRGYYPGVPKRKVLVNSHEGLQHVLDADPEAKPWYDTRIGLFSDAKRDASEKLISSSDGPTAYFPLLSPNQGQVLDRVSLLLTFDLTVAARTQMRPDKFFRE